VPYTYTSAANYNGTDSFTYLVDDGQGGTDVGTVYLVTIEPVNDPPVAANDSAVAVAGHTLTVASPGVLGNDSDVDGEALTAVLVSGPAHGSLVLYADGSYTYSPTAGYQGSDSFTYKANDGTVGSNTVTVSLTVVEGDVLAAAGPAKRGRPAAASPPTRSQLDRLVQVAIAHWAASGAPSSAVLALARVRVEVVDLPGAVLALTAKGVIRIDRDAAGYGWFVDASPWDDAEFAARASGPQRQASPRSAAAGKMDLLTVLAHELGHILGLKHDASGVMERALPVGTRRLISNEDRRQLLLAFPPQKNRGRTPAPVVRTAPKSNQLLALEALFSRRAPS
jgi:hypothetical protein